MSARRARHPPLRTVHPPDLASGAGVVVVIERQNAWPAMARIVEEGGPLPAHSARRWRRCDMALSVVAFVAMLGALAFIAITARMDAQAAWWWRGVAYVVAALLLPLYAPREAPGPRVVALYEHIVPVALLVAGYAIVHGIEARGVFGWAVLGAPAMAAYVARTWLAALWLERIALTWPETWKSAQASAALEARSMPSN